MCITHAARARRGLERSNKPVDGWVMYKNGWVNYGFGWVKYRFRWVMYKTAA